MVVEKKKFKTATIIDAVLDMPREINQIVGEEFELRNSSYLHWTVGETKEDEYNENINKFDNWLLDHLDADTQVLILYWW